MNIAITSTGSTLESAIDPRFGRAKFFVVVDTETGSFKAHDNRQNLQATQGAGIQAAQNVAALGVQAVISGNAGPKAFRVLSAAGIAVFGALIHGRVDAVDTLPEPARPLAYVADFDRLTLLGQPAVEAARSAYASGLTTVFAVAAAVALAAALVSLTAVRTKDFPGREA